MKHICFCDPTERMKTILSSLSDASQSNVSFFIRRFTISLFLAPAFFPLFSFSSFTTVTHIVQQTEAQSGKTSDPSTSI